MILTTFLFHLASKYCHKIVIPTPNWDVIIEHCARLRFLGWLDSNSFDNPGDSTLTQLNTLLILIDSTPTQLNFTELRIFIDVANRSSEKTNSVLKTWEYLSIDQEN